MPQRFNAMSVRGRVVAGVVCLLATAAGLTDTAIAREPTSAAIPGGDGVDDPTVALVRDADGTLAVVELGGPDDGLTAAEVDDREVLAVDVDGPITGAQATIPEPDPVRSVQYHLDAIDAEAMWPVGTGLGTTIAVIDSGVRATHVDFTGRLLPGACFLGSGGNPCPQPGQGPEPFHPHGTHVAGIAAAGAGDGLGVVGVAPAADILPVRVLDGDNSGFLSDLAAGILHALQTDLDGDGVVPDVDVINLSIQSQTSNSVVAGAIAAAVDAGVPVVASAGNLAGVGNPTVFPAAEPNVIGVGSVGPGPGGLVRAPTSSTGPWVDLVAPGVDIWSAGIDDDSDVSLRSGTSMSAPQVSGAIAALLGADPTLGVAEVADLLAGTATDLGAAGVDPEHGAGVIDLAALAAASGAPPAPVELTATPAAGVVGLRWSGGPDGTTAWAVEVDGEIEAVLPADARSADLASGLTTPAVYGVHPIVHYVRVEGAVSDPVSPLLPPGPPTNLVVDPGPARLDLRWAAPLDPGGGSSLDYVVRVLLEGAVVRELVTPSTVAVVRDLPPRGLYDIEVAARTDVGTGAAATASAETLGLTAPGEPVVRTVIVAGEALILDWEPVIGPAEFYDIISPAGLIERLPGDVTIWEGPPSEDRLARLIAVVAVNDLGTNRSEWQRMPDLPGEVRDLSTEVEGEALVVRWLPPVGEPAATGYVVEWGPPGSVTNREWVTEAFITIRPDDVAVPLEVVVRAQTDLAVGWPVSIEVPALFAAPTPASGLTLDLAGAADEGIALRWRPGGGDVELVIVERRIAEGAWRPIVLLSNDDREAVDRRAAVGLVNSYRIRSVGPGGEAVSETSTVLVPIPITEPLDLTVSSDRPAALDVSWTAPRSGPPDGYEITVRDGERVVTRLVRTDLSVALGDLPTGVRLTVEVRALDAGRSGPPAAVVVDVPPPGYWLVTADGALLPFGGAAAVLDARSVDVTSTDADERIVDATSTASAGGVAVLLSDGTLVPVGDVAVVAFEEDVLEDGELAAAVALTPSGAGAWLVTDRGRVIVRGDATFHGDLSDTVLNGLIVGIAPTPSGEGYLLAAADGGVFAFGDATFHGSMGGRALNAAIVGIAGTTGGEGYSLAAADGGVFAFGDAAFHGSMGGRPLNQPIVGIVSSGAGYLLAAADGGVFAFGPDAVFAGSHGDRALDAPVIGIVGRRAAPASGGEAVRHDGPDIGIETHPEVTAADLDVLDLR